VLVAVALVAGLVVVLDLMGALFQPPVERAQPDRDYRGRWWVTETASSWTAAAGYDAYPTSSVRRRLEIRVTHVGSHDEVHAKYDLWLPTDHPLYEQAEGGRGVAETNYLVRDVLGIVSVGDYPEGFAKRVTSDLSFGPPQASRDDVTHGHLHLEAVPYRITLPDIEVYVHPSLRPLRTESDDVVIDKGDQTVYVRGPRERVQYPVSLVVVDRQLMRDGELVTIGWGNLRDETLLTGLRRLGGAALPAVGAGVWGLLGALTAVLVLWWLARGRATARCANRPEDVARWTDLYWIVAVTVGLMVGHSVVNLALGLDYLGPWARHLLSWFWTRPQSYPALSGGGILLTVVGAVAVFPLATLRRAPWQRPEQSESRPWWTVLPFAVLAAVVALTLAAGWVAITRAGYYFPTWSGGKIALAAGAWVALDGAVVLIIRRLARMAGLTGWVLPCAAGSVAALAAAGLHYVETAYYQQSNVTRNATFATAAGALIITYAAFMATAVRRLYRLSGRERIPWWLGPLAAAVVVALTGFDLAALILKPVPELDLGPASVIDLADSLGWLSGFLIFACVLVALYKLGPEQGYAPPDSRFVYAAGVLFVAYTFYWEDRWAYLPITVLVGIVVALLLLRQGSDTDAVDELERLLATVGRSLGHERDALLAQRKAVLLELRRGKIEDVIQYRRKRRAIEAAIEAIGLPSGRTAGRVEPPEEERLRGGGWDQGRDGARNGALLGLPWVGLLLWQVRGQGIDQRSGYEALNFIGWLTWVLIQWPVYGFFYGYFYPWLRGRTGAAKGVVLLVIVILPPVLYAALWNEGADWHDYVVFALQMSLFAVPLGIITGDLFLLKRASLGWRQLVDRYHMRSFALWGTAITVALGGVVTAALTTGINGLVSLLIEQVGQHHPAVPAPAPTP
jgi:hypothetical protein